ncbi:hypothetical protein D9M73_196290 [compost metagenome]
MFDHLAAAAVDTVATDGDVERFAGHEQAFAVHAWCDQFECATGIALAMLQYLQGATGRERIEVPELLLLELRGAHHEACAGGVDETAAIEGDAIGVGQYVVGRAPEDFLRPLDQRGVAADHFVKNGRGGLALKLRVGRQGTGQLRLPGCGGVVQHQARGGNVVVDELVV